MANPVQTRLGRGSLQWAAVTGRNGRLADAAARTPDVESRLYALAGEETVPPEGYTQEQIDAFWKMYLAERTPNLSLSDILLNPVTGANSRGQATASEDTEPMAGSRLAGEGISSHAPSMVNIPGAIKDPGGTGKKILSATAMPLSMAWSVMSGLANTGLAAKRARETMESQLGPGWEGEVEGLESAMREAERLGLDPEKYADQLDPDGSIRAAGRKANQAALDTDIAQETISGVGRGLYGLVKGLFTGEEGKEQGEETAPGSSPGTSVSLAQAAMVNSPWGATGAGAKTDRGGSFDSAAGARGAADAGDAVV